MPKLYTIGHSSHSFEEFYALLKSYAITHLVDVRAFPKSRHVPWFNEKELDAALREVNISYLHITALGGRRRTNRDSINLGWRNTSFRGYADYMQTSEFYAGLKKLNQLLGGKRRVVIMCAEALPWRCHRSLIADAEIVRGITVFDILSRTSAREHTLTSFAKVDRSKRPIKITYPR
ncbi:Uncharacterized conserved protein [Legionella busanensis]|uniref:Uncharacterized conserved protein n=1 Tax=Legionella busanensis TaxID=190655 RepID=A0A378KDI9_9GAMM|nr:DUF488 domain-containing protein [Legionella busanensis]STX81695.1 Uncharacterized conserved protein [Legionella busanensis]